MLLVKMWYSCFMQNSRNFPQKSPGFPEILVGGFQICAHSRLIAWILPSSRKNNIYRELFKPPPVCRERPTWKYLLRTPFADILAVSGAYFDRQRGTLQGYWRGPVPLVLPCALVFCYTHCFLPKQISWIVKTLAFLSVRPGFRSHPWQKHVLQSRDNDWRARHYKWTCSLPTLRKSKDLLQYAFKN